MADNRQAQVKYRAKFQKGTNQLYFAPYYYFKTSESSHEPHVIEDEFNGKVNKTVVTLLADWNTLDTTGIYEVISQASNVANSPEPGKVACYVTVADGYITQLAVGDRVFKRCMPATTQVWEDWVVLQDYRTNSRAVFPPANSSIKTVTHLLMASSRTLKIKDMVEGKAYVFHLVASEAIVTLKNDDTVSYTVSHRGTGFTIEADSTAAFNNASEPAGEIWVAKFGTKIYMSKSCEDGKVPSAYAADSATNATNATNADITKTSSATNGDTLQIGNGNAVTIGNAAKSNKAKYSDGGNELDKANWLYRYNTPSPVMIQNGGTVGWIQCPSMNNTTFFVIGHRNNGSDANGGICPAPKKRLVEIDFYVDIMFPFNSLQDHWQTFAFRAKTESSYNRTESFAQNDSSYFAEARVSTWVKGKYIESGDAETTIHVRLVGYLDDVGTGKSIVVGCRSLFGVGSVGITPYYQIKGYNYNVLCSSLEGQTTY